MAGKRFIENEKNYRNRSISHHFRDKGVFAFNAAIQDGHQKWREKIFKEKTPVQSANILGVKIFF